MDQTQPKQIGTEGVVASTPNSRSDGKREATSPLDVQDLQNKKTRHGSGSSCTSAHSETEGDLFDVDPQPQVDGAIHLLSQPLNPPDIVQIATELRSMMVPELRALLTDMMPFIKTIVKEAVQEATGTLNEEVQKLKEENKNIKKANCDLEKRLSQVEYDNDSLEQYSRRNSLRISGVSEEINEDTDSVIMKIAEELDVPLAPSDIDRSHRVGKIDEQQGRNGKRRHRDILVKFATYNARRRLFIKRKDLRDMEHMKHLYVNEDLTKLRSKLLYDARCLFRVDILKAAYASDGKVFVRDQEDHRHLIKTDSDIAEFGDPKEARNELARRARQPPSAGAAGTQ